MVAYRRPRDALASILPPGLFGLYACATLQKLQGQELIVGIPVDQCYRMLPARRFTGIWLDEFEGSQFFDGARDANAVKAEVRRNLGKFGYPSEWLEWRPGYAPAVSSDWYHHGHLIAVDFIGRKTAYPGHYGHMGGWRSDIVVDRVISAREIYQSRGPYLGDELGKR